MSTAGTLATARAALQRIAEHDPYKVSGAGDIAREALAAIDAAPAPRVPTLATAEHLARARADYVCDDINIDDGAEFSECDDGAGWVQAWVYIGPTE